MIRVLMVLGGPMGFDGAPAFLMNYYHHLDRTRIQFDFVYQDNARGVYDEEIQQMGGRIYHVPSKSKHPVAFTKRLYQIIEEGNYIIVHGHLNCMNWWVLWIAKKAGAPIRISHSHSTSVNSHSPIRNALHNTVKKMIPLYATDLWACGIDAGKWLYGDRFLDRVVVINNAIDVKQFQFSEITRKKIREKHGISETTFVVGHCGRMVPIKNHKLLIDAFSRVVEKIPDSVLLLVGDGVLENELEKQVKVLAIEDKVIFAGSQRCRRVLPAEVWSGCGVLPGILRGRRLRRMAVLRRRAGGCKGAFIIALNSFIVHAKRAYAIQERLRGLLL